MAAADLLPIFLKLRRYISAVIFSRLSIFLSLSRFRVLNFFLIDKSYSPLCCTSKAPGHEYCPMIKKLSLILAFSLAGIAVYCQSPRRDTITSSTDDLLIDTTIDYDELFKDFDAFMDSILNPGSYLIANISASRGYYNVESKTSAVVTAVKKMTYTPSLGYYHKGGLGITATGYVLNEQKSLNLYQFGITPSFDYLKNRNFAAGISYTKFFTKDSLSFYTTPIQNEVYAYFTYRKWWVRPAIGVSYGWGSRTDYEEREEQLLDLRIRRRGFTYIQSKESVKDFSLMASVRHDFYWLEVLSKKDHIRFTPQLSFTSGTQKYGFNQSSNTYATLLRTGSNVLFSSENVYLDDELKFQPLSLTLYLRTEYSFGKFFIQPQFVVDYYFPASNGNLNSLFSVNAGFIF